MYSEQFAILLLMAATQLGGQGLASQPMAQVPRGGVEKIGLQLKQDKSLLNARKQSNRVKREREAMMLAEFH
jgi:hypothetical protein